MHLGFSLFYNAFRLFSFFILASLTQASANTTKAANRPLRAIVAKLKLNALHFNQLFRPSFT